MNIEDVRLECVSCHPAVEETFPFDDTNLVMKIGGKMFALLPLDNPDTISLKCDPALAVELRERYAGINPAWHFNKVHWIQIDISSVPDDVIRAQVAMSFSLVADKLTRKAKASRGL